MKWLECNIFTKNEGIEPIVAVLMEIGITGVQIEDDFEIKDFLKTNSSNWDYVDEELMNKEIEETLVKFYLLDNNIGNETLLSVRTALKLLASTKIGLDMGRLSLEIANVDDEDWLDNWKKYYKPFRIGRRIVIKPEWEDYQRIMKEDIIFTINPGHVFGTGLHQTTALCIEQLERYVAKGISVLDLGCGSGILSIISLLLGADKALAVDIDENAIKVAYGNALLNGFSEKDLGLKYKVVAGNILMDDNLKETFLTNKYNIITANIVADVIIGISSFAAQCIEKGGYFISSGIIRERLEEVKETLIENGFSIKEIFYKDDWICIVSTF